MWRLFTEATHSIASTTRKRLTEGPKRPSWSLAYEAQIELVRRQNLSPHPSLAVRRRDFDRVRYQELLKRRIRTERRDCGGVPGVAIEARSGHKRPGQLLYLHGGSYVMGSTHSHLPLLAWVACLWGMPVLSIEYSLAPERPCPAAIDDALKAYRWLREQGHSGPLYLAGDSAGGGLALAAMVALREAGEALPHKAVLLSPWTDLSLGGLASMEPPEHDYLMPRDLKQNAEHYRGGLPPEDPRVSPLFAELAGLPPLYILAGELEVLLPDSTRLAEKAREAGVSVMLDIAPDEIHVFPAFGPVSPQAELALRRIHDGFLSPD